MILTSGYPPYFSLPDKVKREEAFYFGFPNKRTDERMMRKKEFFLLWRLQEHLTD
jgi:hypothetical protein